MENKLPLIVTRPVVSGVEVKWRWPENAYGEAVQLQCLYQDNRLTDEIFGRTVRGKEITNLKPGEKIQIRARLVDHHGNGPDWTASDWQDGIALESSAIGSVRFEGGSVVFKDPDGSVRVKIEKLNQEEVIKPATGTAQAIAKEAMERQREIAAERFAIFGESDTSNETIEQHTLSAVLSSTLHLVDADQAGDVAVKLAQAVKSAFQTLNTGLSGGKMSQQWGIKMD